MKKITSILLALVMCLGLCSTVFATPVEKSDEGSASEATTFVFAKKYTSTNGSELPSGIYPAEKLKFKVEAAKTNPAGQSAPEIEDTTVDGNPDDISITIPAYTKVGKYDYTVSEIAGSTQGVTYSENSFGIQVLVSYDSEGSLVKQVAFTSGTTGKKIDSITNKYAVSEGGEKHGLTVTKKVTGNMGSTTTAFDIEVTFSSDNPVASSISYNNAGTAGTIATSDWSESDGKYIASVTVNLKDSASATFDYIPAGVTYVVEEDSKYANKDDNGSNNEAGYTVSYEGQTATIKEGDAISSKVTNNKGTTVDTGINMDSVPYIVICGLVVLGAAVVLTKKRFSSED